MRKARLFAHEGSQAVELPADFRFEGDFVYVRRDERTGDVIVSARPRTSLADFLALSKALGPVELDMPRDTIRQDRDPLADFPE